MFMIVLILLLNVGISWWNARVSGMCWAESKALGGFGRIVIWSAAIQSAVGFTMVYLFVEAGLLSFFSVLGTKAMNEMISLGMLAIIVPAIGSGLIIMVYSWMEAYRNRDFASVGVAAYNTIAMAQNVANVASAAPSMLSSVGDLFSSDDEDSWVLPLVIGAVVLAIGGGIFSTYAIVQKYKGRSLGRQFSQTA